MTSCKIENHLQYKCTAVRGAHSPSSCFLLCAFLFLLFFDCISWGASPATVASGTSSSWLSASVLLNSVTQGYEISWTLQNFGVINEHSLSFCNVAIATYVMTQWTGPIFILHFGFLISPPPPSVHGGKYFRLPEVQSSYCHLHHLQLNLPTFFFVWAIVVFFCCQKRKCTVIPNFTVNNFVLKQQ